MYAYAHAMKRITIVDGHPDPSEARLNHALASRYAEEALAAGHEVRRIDVARLDFPLLRIADDFYNGEAPHAIRDGQRDIAWADHLVFFYPLWVGDMPALLKAFIEQTFRPGFALAYGGPRQFPKKLLVGKSARIVVTMGMPAFIYRAYFGAHALKSIELNLGMCGIAPVRETLIGSVMDANEKRGAKWLDRMASLVEEDSVPARHEHFNPIRPLVATGLFAVATYAAYAAATWAGYGRAKRRDSLLDGVMPEYELRLHHSVHINAPAGVTFDAMQNMDFERSPIVQALFRAREIVLHARHVDRPMPTGLLAQLADLGWTIVAREAGRELVFATITQPWQANPVFRGLPSDEFVRFNEPGYAKIAFTLRVDPVDATKSIARTETRVQTTDPVSHDRFRRYWALLSPGIELIRRVLLQQLKAEAESHRAAA